MCCVRDQQYYNGTRTHLALAKDSPLTRSVQAIGKPPNGSPGRSARPAGGSRCRITSFVIATVSQHSAAADPRRTAPSLGPDLISDKDRIGLAPTRRLFFQ